VPWSSRTDDAPGVEALDDLAGQLLLRAGARLGVAHTEAELEAVFRLRYDHVVRHGWARAEELPDGLERDADDDRALQLTAWRGPALVGTMRLVLPVPGRRLPTEAAFDLDVEPLGEVVDVGRLLIGAPYRGDPAHRLWGGLFALAWQETRARGYSVLAGVTSEREITTYRSLGLAFEVLGPARHYWGAERHPVRLDPATGGQPGWFGAP
jgi:N-acyl amino acid synthase FeeM